MKHNMQELSVSELEAVCGGGLLEDIIDAIARFFSGMTELFDQGHRSVEELYEIMQQKDVAL